MPNHSVRMNQVFQALSDPTRRAVLRRLSRGPAATLELARPFAMALPSMRRLLALPLLLLTFATSLDAAEDACSNFKLDVSNEVKLFQQAPANVAAGGQAQPARRAFMHLPRSDRERLLAWVSTL